MVSDIEEYKQTHKYIICIKMKDLKTIEYDLIFLNSVISERLNISRWNFNIKIDSSLEQGYGYANSVIENKVWSHIKYDHTELSLNLQTDDRQFCVFRSSILTPRGYIYKIRNCLVWRCKTLNK